MSNHIDSGHTPRPPDPPGPLFQHGDVVARPTVVSGRAPNDLWCLRWCRNVVTSLLTNPCMVSVRCVEKHTSSSKAVGPDDTLFHRGFAYGWEMMRMMTMANEIIWSEMIRDCLGWIGLGWQIVFYHHHSICSRERHTVKSWKKCDEHPEAQENHGSCLCMESYKRTSCLFSGDESNKIVKHKIKNLVLSLNVNTSTLANLASWCMKHAVVC